MAKGRRSGGSGGKGSPSQQPSREDAKLKRWETDEDIPDDVEDSFHRNRDKILLGGGDDDDDEGDLRATWSSGREVLGVDQDEEEDDDDDDGDDDGQAYMDEDGEGDEDEYVGRRKAARAKREAKALAAMRPGSKAAAPDDSDSEGEADPTAAAAEDEEEHTGWGPHKKAYYNTNDLDDMSSDSELDEEERREIEIREVRKLHSRARADMVDEDFGLGDAVDAVSEARDRKKRKAELDEVAISPAAPVVAPKVVELPSSAADKAALLAQVQRATPETIALAGDFADVVAELSHVDGALKRAIKETPDHPSIALFHLHHQTLLTYISSLIYYFHLRVQPQYVAAPAALNTHPIMGRLLKLKQSLASLEDLGFAAGAQESEEGSEEEEEEEDQDEIDPSEETELGSIFEPTPFDGDSVGSLESDELAQLAAEEAEQAAQAKKKGAKKVVIKAKKEAKKKQAKKRGEAVAIQPKAAAPLASLADLADEAALSETTKAKRKRTAGPTVGDLEAAEAFGEPSALSAADSSDKAARRRSLKFHTGQITAKEARRGQAGRNNLGGDADIPYRDRERSRMAVAQAAANKAAKAAALENGSSRMDEGLDDLDFGVEDLADWRDVMGGDGGGPGDFGEGAGADEMDADDGYYDLVSKKRKKERDDKRQAYEAEQDETRFIDDASLAPGEHRAITRQIEKNKGLSQRRPKANRNPRVKKRLKFEKAQKKLSSMGPVYKGGLAALEGGYQGEKSGISSHVVKSRRFGG